MQWNFDDQIHPSYDDQMNGIDIHLGHMNLRDVLDGKWTARYESISDILISMFLGVIQTFAGSSYIRD